VATLAMEGFNLVRGKVEEVLGYVGCKV